VLCLSSELKAESIQVDAEMLRQLQATILRQEELLRRQTEQIRLQSERLDALQHQVEALGRREKKPMPAASVPATETREAGSGMLPEPPPFSVSSGNNKVKLAISGQLNRAFTLAGDGRSPKFYPVDNSNSSSRIRVTGTAEISDELSLGTRFEVAISPDASSKVSQIDQSPGNWFDQRWAEISLSSVHYGKLSLGKGDTASNNTAEVDLSGTDVALYTKVSDIAGGLLFRERGGDKPFTEVKVSDVFQNRDGLSRESRLRYDTPAFYGFSIAASLVSNQRYDAAVFWGGEGYGFKASGAFAVSNPKLPCKGLQYDGSLSVLHLGTGLNLSMSGGLQEQELQKDAINLYGKIGWLASLTTLGNTAFGVDYTRSENLPLSGDNAWSVGAGIVQSFKNISTELYVLYRIYSLDRKTGPAVKNINLGSFGARVKF
jgi:predicted porin